ncbi:MAG: FMN-binding glutamate synthase family protein, partial [Nitrososphaerota archaeon]
LPELKNVVQDVSKIPCGALGVYSYLERIKIGMQQLLAGLRKFKLYLISRNDIFALSERAAKATGIPLAEESGVDEIEAILLDD